MALKFHSENGCYKRQLKKILKKHKRSKEHILDFIDDLLLNPDKAKHHRNFPDEEDVRKIRIPLSNDNIGASNSLRFVFMIVGNTMIRVAIYKHNEFKDELDINRMIKENYKEILKGLEE